MKERRIINDPMSSGVRMDYTKTIKNYGNVCNNTANISLNLPTGVLYISKNYKIK